MKKVLVTGGAGYIGSHTCVELHKAGFTPVIMDNLSNSDERMLDGIASIVGEAPIFFHGDATDHAAVSKVFSDFGPFVAVIHFAAYKAVGASVKDPLTYYRNNVGSTQVVLEHMQKHGCHRLVFSSSCTVYGQPDHLPVSEESPLAEAQSPYGFSKQVCERMIQDCVRAPHASLSSVLLRYFNPIGAHPSGKIGELPLGVPENLVPYITQTAAGLRDSLTVFGDDYDTMDGTCVRDYIHVCDLAEAHVQAMNWLLQQPQTIEAVNLGTGQGNTVKEVIQTFEKVSGEVLNWSIGPRRPGDVEKIFASSDKAAQLFHWHTRFSLEDALRDAWNWQQQLSKIKEVASAGLFKGTGRKPV